jgi:hypothetical protein
MTAVPAMTSCSARRRPPQQDVGEPQSQEQEAQPERQRAHDRPALACIGAVVCHDPRAEQRVGVP